MRIRFILILSAIYLWWIWALILLFNVSSSSPYSLYSYSSLLLYRTRYNGYCYRKAKQPVEGFVLASYVLLITPHEVSFEPGIGPRHLEFHPSLPYAFVLHELGSSISGIFTSFASLPLCLIFLVCSYDANAVPALRVLGTVSLAYSY